jgi:proline iminopeptidase
MLLRASRTLYPEIAARVTGHLAVTGGHSIYYEESGHPTGKPVVFLHGGPGAGTSPKCRRFFNPETVFLITSQIKFNNISIIFFLVSDYSF